MKSIPLLAAGKPAQEVSASTPDNLRDNRDANWMFNGRLNPAIPYATGINYMTTSDDIPFSGCIPLRNLKDAPTPCRRSC